MGDRYGADESSFPVMRTKVSLPLDRVGEARDVREVPDGKKVDTVQRNGRLEFEAEVRLHAIYEIF